MTIIALDDEDLALKGMMSKLKSLCPEDDVQGFFDVEQTLIFASQNKVDIAFLDIEMAEINGVEVAKRLREYNPFVNIIFATGYKEYMEDAFSLFASGYITKPVTEDKIKEQLENLRYPIDHGKKYRVVAKTFGSFEIFVDDMPLKFKYGKTKEFLAILIDRAGKMTTSGELESILWEDEDSFADHSSYLRNLQVDLLSTFRQKGLEDLIIKQRGAIAIDINKVDCDYINFFKSLVEDVPGPKFFGEYMAQYSWAESRIPMFEEARPWK